MARIKYYGNEHKMLKEIGFNNNKQIENDDALKIIKKITRHFKFSVSSIRFYGGIVNNRGMAYPNGCIRLQNQPKIGTILHELAHVYNLNKYHNWRHSKKLMRTVKRFAKYTLKKNYWNMGIPEESFIEVMEKVIL